MIDASVEVYALSGGLTGTGTQLGDITETNALGRVFRTYRSAKDPLIV